MTSLVRPLSGPPIVEIWHAWNWEPLLLAGLGGAAWLYLLGVRRVWQRAGIGHGLRKRQVWFFYTGLVVLALALVSPLDVAGHVLFSVHMVQHVVLINMVAPLLVLGNASYGWLWGLPRSARLGLGPWWHQRRVLQSLAGIVMTPVVAWTSYAAVLWLWHVPVAYETALRNDIVHALEHVSFIGAAVLFWWHLLRRRIASSPSYGTGIILAFATMLHSGLLGALITFAPIPWYPNYVTNTAAWGIGALPDQQLAGVIMWVPTSLLYLVVTVALLGQWLKRFSQGEKKMSRYDGRQYTAGETVANG